MRQIQSKSAIVAVLAWTLFVTLACAGSQLKKATDTLNTVTNVYNTLGPIVEQLHESGAISDSDYNKIAAADAEIHKGILDAWDALILVKAGNGSWTDYYAKVQVLVEVLERHKIELTQPQIQALIQTIIGLLGAK